MYVQVAMVLAPTFKVEDSQETKEKPPKLTQGTSFLRSECTRLPRIRLFISEELYSSVNTDVKAHKSYKHQTTNKNTSISLGSSCHTLKVLYSLMVIAMYMHVHPHDDIVYITNFN